MIDFYGKTVYNEFANMKQQGENYYENRIGL